MAEHDINEELFAAARRDVVAALTAMRLDHALQDRGRPTFEAWLSAAGSELHANETAMLAVLTAFAELCAYLLRAVGGGGLALDQQQADLLARLTTEFAPPPT